MEQQQEKSWSAGPRVSQKAIRGFEGLLAVGAVVFLVGLWTDPLRSWQAYHVNFLFWGGMAQGAIVFAAIYHVVGGRWGPPVRRCAEGMVAFLPVNFLLFLPLYFGLQRFYGPVREINPERGAWFDPRFIFVRGGLGLGLMTVLSLFFVYYSLRPEVGSIQEQKLRPHHWLYDWISDGWQGEQLEAQRCQRGLDVFSAGVLVAYPITYTFMAFDLIMSLDPFWYSSLFGGYFFISTFYLGLAAIATVCVLIRRQLGPSAFPSSQLSDLARLLLGFNLTYLAMVWSQYIVIWYGNLPEETHFIIQRFWEKPWAPLTWSIFVFSVLIPFLIFLSKTAKRKPQLVLTVSVSVALGLWLERYILVVPSLWHRDALPLGWIDLGLTAGFLGAAGLSYLFFLQHFPVLPFVSSIPSAEFEKKEGEESRVKVPLPG